MDKQTLLTTYRSGRFANFLEQLESEPDPLKTKMREKQIGAYTLIGKTEHAHYLFRTHRNELDLEARAEAEAMLVLADIRESRYEDALGRTKSLWSYASRSYWSLLALAMIRFFQERYDSAAKVARKATLVTEDRYQRLIATDLLAHSLLANGDISKGLAAFRQAHGFAVALDNPNFTAAIKIASLSGSMQVGRQKNALRSAQRASSNLKPEDTYSRNQLTLAMARLQILQGSFSEAEALLAQRIDEVYRTNNKRQIAKFTAAMAHLQYVQGNVAAAKQSLWFAEQYVDKDQDILIRCQIIGQRRQIAASLGDRDLADSLLKELEELTKQTTFHIATRHLRRQKDLPPIGLPGEDPIGDLADRAHRKDPTAISDIIESGMLLLLTAYFKWRPGQSIFVRGLAPKHSLLCSPAGLKLLPRLSLQAERLLHYLAEQPRSKEDIVRSIWGYEYHPLKHDAMFHSFLSRLRKWLGESPLLQVDDQNRYTFLAETIDVSPERPNRFTEKERASKTMEDELDHLSLNHRQWELLRFGAEEECFSIRWYLRKFSISRMTAYRDLDDLVQKSVLQRVGASRNCRYKFRESRGI